MGTPPPHPFCMSAPRNQVSLHRVVDRESVKPGGRGKGERSEGREGGGREDCSAVLN